MVRQEKETALEWFDEEIQKYIYHPLAYYFEKWTNKLRDRFKFAFILSFVLALFSRIQPICTQNRCYTYYVELLIKPELLFKPFSFSALHTPFVTVFVFFFIIWMIALSIGHLLQKNKVFHHLLIPIIVVCLFIYLFFTTTGMVRPFMLETGAFECTTGDDCVRAGYCGEVCASVYRPIYTTYRENCTALTSCSCINYRCEGS